MRLGILATHPVQYHAPLFRALAREEALDTTVYFGHRPTPEEQGAGFGVSFEWDVDLTGGFAHEWLQNRASRPSMVTFWGCNTPEIGAIIERERFDAFLVHGWYIFCSWQAFRACRRSRTPLIVRGDSQLPPGGPGVKGLVKKAVYPRFIKRFDLCLAYGQRSEEYFRHYGAKRVMSSPHFVDNDWFRDRAAEARPERAASRREWGFEPDAFVFLFAGKFEPKKRPLDIIAAAARAQAQAQQRLGLLMVGDGVLRAECERAAEAAGLNACFPGFMNQGQMPRAYAAADCLALASDSRETWGLVVNEAMACGLPAIVSSQAGCVPDLIVEGETGHSYACGDVAELAAKMCRVADNASQAEALGAGAFEHIQGHSVARAAAGIVEGVAAAAAGRRGANVETGG